MPRRVEALILQNLLNLRWFGVFGNLEARSLEARNAIWTGVGANQRLPERQEMLRLPSSRRTSPVSLAQTSDKRTPKPGAQSTFIAYSPRDNATHKARRYNVGIVVAYPRQLSRQGSAVGKPEQIHKRARGVSPTSQRHVAQVHAISVVNVTTITGGDCIG